MSLERIVEKAFPFAAGNALLLWGVQEGAPYLNALYDKTALFEGVTNVALTTSVVYGVWKVGYWDWMVSNIRRETSLLKKTGQAIISSTPIAVAGYGALLAAPYVTRVTEEIVHNGLAIGAVYAANRLVINPLGNLIAGATSKGVKWASRIGFGALAAGLLLTNNVQNTIRDVRNTAVTVHDTALGEKQTLGRYALYDGMVHPVEGVITSRFWFRKNPVERSYGTISEYFIPEAPEFHSGVDIGVPLRTPIMAPVAGKVHDISGTGLNRNVVIQYGEDKFVVLKHNSEILVKKGEGVKVGERIALSGRAGTGPHVHMAVVKGGKPINPL